MFYTMRICVQCDDAFEPYPVVAGVKLNLYGRQRCLACLPLRRLSKPRRKVSRALAVKTCDNCGREFPGRTRIDGRVHYLYRRRFCLDCSPFGAHNTATRPPGAIEPTALKERRRKRRSAKTYRYQKKRRRVVKAHLVSARGGMCEDCGYASHLNALEFHHLDPTTKKFTISTYTAQFDLARLEAESAKCVLVCANCHRIRHVPPARAGETLSLTDVRRATKARAVALMGGSCEGCGRDGPTGVFEFHHRESATKEFGIGEDGVVRPWHVIVAELAKCVMLCANCHREVHAGVRWIDDGLLGLAEAARRYDSAWGRNSSQPTIAKMPTEQIATATHQGHTAPRTNSSMYVR